MALSQQQFETLQKMLSLTRSQELSCDECFRRMAEFAENALADQSVPEDLKALEHHLAICKECQEEFKALVKALEADTTGRD